ncbi:MAG TPA: hypothetical protein DCM28_03435 [Phycisphaerales bacterium]|nr:hypothetical protein [Phycisphaerales bacterium]|tara:strand:+ start:225 stop:623 length:399 start_codon:yes stop_codon:yes gene_type:complete
MSSEPSIYEIAQQTRYPVDAFIFIQRGLDFTVRRIHGDVPKDLDPEDDSTNRHVSGQELCEGLREFAISQYGLMARTVLRRFKIYATEDFGHLVFAMVDAGAMRKTEEDSIADFVDVYDFSDAFGSELQLSQ